MLKHLQSTRFPSFFAALLNKILAIAEGRLPKSWGSGLALPLFKSGDDLQTTNYRLIVINALFQKLMAKATCLLMEKADPLRANSAQVGFRKGFSTADHCFTLRTVVDHRKAHNKNIFPVLNQNNHRQKKGPQQEDLLLFCGPT